MLLNRLRGQVGRALGALLIARLGGFPVTGSVTWHITAADAAGSTGTGPTSSLVITRCPPPG
ncbi:hypothetical protein [Alloactinosynnema sp. L-07]|uniref:hypothetical protein n=1 Tax=Alloactinosynnema sp. L-07 TaxID=1653480 RepID=UPI00065F08E8|nr:hypothetical protein [Alloactinosynnema sp. L-07]CRK58513.1 hypothetical protein [Alloactinosynnema sp. L-07]